jgi:hypothetical protein
VLAQALALNFHLFLLELHESWWLNCQLVVVLHISIASSSR